MNLRMEITIAAEFASQTLTERSARDEAVDRPEEWFARLLQWARTEPGAHGVLLINTKELKP